MSAIEVNASNVIKRSMRYNRDRHFYTLAKVGRYNISHGMMIAHLAIYTYTDDTNNCSATMGCDLEIYDILYAESKLRDVDTDTINNNIHYQLLIKSATTIGRYSGFDYTSKKLVRLIHNDMTLDELRSSAGWTGGRYAGGRIRYREGIFSYPSKYIPIRDIMASKISNNEYIQLDPFVYKTLSKNHYVAFYDAIKYIKKELHEELIGCEHLARIKYSPNAIYAHIMTHGIDSITDIDILDDNQF